MNSRKAQGNKTEPLDDPAGEQDKERDAGEKDFSAQLAYHQDTHCGCEYGQSRPRGLGDDLGEPTAFLPDYECGKQLHEEAVIKIGIIPPLQDVVREGDTVEQDRENDENGRLPVWKGGPNQPPLDHSRRLRMTRSR